MFTKRRMIIIDTLLNTFFIISFITFFITFYSIYSFFEIYFFHHMQGSKLNIKNKAPIHVAAEKNLLELFEFFLSA